MSLILLTLLGLVRGSSFLFLAYLSLNIFGVILFLVIFLKIFLVSYYSIVTEKVKHLVKKILKG